MLNNIIKWVKSPIGIILIVLLISGILSPINDYKRGNFFASLSACAFEDHHLACIIFMLANIALLIWGLAFVVMGIINYFKDKRDKRDRYNG